MTISATMTKSNIFSLAHQICKFKDSEKIGNNIFRFLTINTYKARLSKALKYIYREIKKAVEAMNAPAFDFELCAAGKAISGATYKQINYLSSFENVSIEVSNSQILKRIERFEMSEAIERAIAGQTVRIY